ncbi:uncharacterized protein Dwil_GK18688 [Drosophila willistoni]|uniref:Chitin-binding type-2 domain-containing protein n=1 Tax=Drosophila willistoni TaxID=7260 RepID=A0A0Q9X3W9_DROWI|nr:uncharacterized protein LOC6648237 [Drosophila willistoni]KRF99536.1 uncharacterized protein Dwil_GK18688 [Drosophila willistoni]
MKAALIAVLFLAFVAAVLADCNPNVDGKPASCAGVRGVVNYRNNFDPTHYWQCNGDTTVESVACGNGGFLTSANDCVSWSEWSWEPVCSS